MFWFSLPLSTIQSTHYYLLGSAPSGLSVDDFLLVNLFKSPTGVPGVNGVRGVVLVDPDGESGPDVVSRDKLLLKLELGRIMVMLRVTGTSTGRIEDERVWEGENESYFRSLPRPDSGAGPARVSSQSLWRKPMLMMNIYMFRPRNSTTATKRYEGTKPWKREKKTFFLFFLLSVWVKMENSLIPLQYPQKNSMWTGKEMKVSQQKSKARRKKRKRKYQISLNSLLLLLKLASDNLISSTFFFSLCCFFNYSPLFPLKCLELHVVSN